MVSRLKIFFVFSCFSLCLVNATVLPDSHFARLCAAIRFSAKECNVERQIQFSQTVNQFTQLYHFKSEKIEYPFREALNTFSRDYAADLFRQKGSYDRELYEAFVSLSDELVGIKEWVDAECDRTGLARAVDLPKTDDIEQTCAVLSEHFYVSHAWLGASKVLRSKLVWTFAILTGGTGLLIWTESGRNVAGKIKAFMPESVQNGLINFKAGCAALAIEPALFNQLLEKVRSEVGQ